MPSFGRAFERAGVRYLLISGQASVLYGAATFSEDVDVWIDPSPLNVERCRRALRRAGARVYKLTPPFTAAFLRRGHVFHFTLPDPALPAYLDILGRPPRVGAFAAARARARTLETGWGAVPVVSIPDLVALKKTRRPQDYETLSNLVRLRLERHADWPGAEPPVRVLEWALDNLFRADDVVWLLDAYPAARTAAAASRRPAVRACVDARRRVRHDARSLARCRRALAGDLLRLQEADIRYWRPILAELRRLRAAGRLLPVGSRL